MSYILADPSKTHNFCQEWCKPYDFSLPKIDMLIWIISSESDLLQIEAINNTEIKNLYVIIDIPNLSNKNQIFYKNRLKSKLSYSLSDSNLFVVNKIYCLDQIIEFIKNQMPSPIPNFLIYGQINWKFVITILILTSIILGLGLVIYDLQTRLEHQDITIRIQNLTIQDLGHEISDMNVTLNDQKLEISNLNKTHHNQKLEISNLNKTIHDQKLEIYNLDKIIHDQKIEQDFNPLDS